MNSKARKALEELCAVDFGKLMFPLDGDSSAIYNSDKKEIPTYWWVAEVLNQVKRAQDTAKSALAEPLRNCDVGTVTEQAERFGKYCEKNSAKCAIGGNGSCQMFKRRYCGIAWTQAPYKKVKK